MVVFLIIGLVVIIAYVLWKCEIDKQYRELEEAVLKKLNFQNWNVILYADEIVYVKSRKTLESYDDVRFFKEI